MPITLTIPANTAPPGRARSPKSRTWLLGYVRGSASGYRRGTVSLRRVTGSVLLALSHGVSDDDVSLVLAAHALRWEADLASVVDGMTPVPYAER